MTDTCTHRRERSIPFDSGVCATCPVVALLTLRTDTVGSSLRRRERWEPLGTEHGVSGKAQTTLSGLLRLLPSNEEIESAISSNFVLPHRRGWR